jgi:hypothetical protein
MSDTIIDYSEGILAQEQLAAGMPYKDKKGDIVEILPDSATPSPLYDTLALEAAERQMRKAWNFASSIIKDSTDTHNLVQVMSTYLNTFNQARYSLSGPTYGSIGS